MIEVKSRQLLDGTIYAIKTHDGLMVEARDVVGLAEAGGCIDRWTIQISTMSGCPVGCRFCATGSMKTWRTLSAEEIFTQVEHVAARGEMDFDDPSIDARIDYTGMGEPFLNTDQLRAGIDRLRSRYPAAHHLIATIGIRGSDFSWISGDVSLQLSVHAIDEQTHRRWIPYADIMSLEEMSRIRDRDGRKISVKVTLTPDSPYDMNALTDLFDVEHFAISWASMTPINNMPRN